MKKLLFATTCLTLWFSNVSAQTNPFPTEIDHSGTVVQTITSGCWTDATNNPNGFPLFVVWVNGTADPFAILLDGSILSEKMYALVTEAHRTGSIMRYYSPANPKYYYSDFGTHGLGPWRELKVLWK